MLIAGVNDTGGMLYTDVNDTGVVGTGNEPLLSNISREFS
jgi:hypothetical protein